MRALTVLTATLLFSVLTLFTAGPADAGDLEAFIVIVHPDNPETELKKDVVSKMFLKKVSKWQDGTNVMPVDQSSGSDIRKVFSKAIHKKTATAVRNYWQQQIFSGRGVPPPEARSDGEVVKHVSENPGGIGYVSKEATLEGVKELKIIY